MTAIENSGEGDCLRGSPRVLARWVAGFCGLIAYVVSVSAALAQPVPNRLPGPVAPGQIERQFEPPPSAPAVVAPPPLALPGAPVAPTAAGPTFVLKDVVVSGVTVYSPDDLKASYQQFIGQTIGADSFGQIEDAIALKYRRDGYILARAVVDPQTIDPSAGVIHVTVYQGFVDKVRLNPLDYEVTPKGAFIKAILSRIERACRPGDEPQGDIPCPLHRDVLERYLLLANDLPGVKATAVVQPAAEASGGADLFVTITEKPLELAATVDNRGSIYVGPGRVQEIGALNNVFGLFDRTEIHAAQSLPLNELWLINGVEEIPLTSDGLRLAVDLTHSRSHPGDTLRSLNIITTGDSGGVTLSYPLIRTRAQNLSVHSSFELHNDITTSGALNDGTLFDDRTRVFTLGATYDLADHWLGVNLVDVSVGQGVPILGATPKSDNSLTQSHAGQNPAFTKFDGEVSRLQEVFPEWNVLGAATGQYSFSKLLTSEQFTYGGERYGRAYDPAEILGDRGVAAKAEVQYTPGWAPGLLGAENGVKALQFYGFGDLGRVWSNPRQAAHISVSGASAGGGIRYSFTDYLSGYFEVAVPLTQPVAALAAKGQTGKDPRFFFSIAAKY